MINSVISGLNELTNKMFMKDSMKGMVQDLEKEFEDLYDSYLDEIEE